MLSVLFTACFSREPVAGDEYVSTFKRTGTMDIDRENLERATLGGGCFWCLEAVYERIEGVQSAVSGYAGGNSADPTYREVTSGSTGHAEVVQVAFDPAIISYEQILTIFFKAHDPTTLNRQGADRGTQYRSIILYHDEQQKKTARKVIDHLNESNKYENSIVTQLEPLEQFYTAEDYHQDFYARNPYQGYCSLVITPKLQKLGLGEAFE